MRIAIIGAGAAGCFAAIEIARRVARRKLDADAGQQSVKHDADGEQRDVSHGAEIVVFESGSKPLAKVAITGGGRCNLTNSFSEVRSMEQVYPRGARQMKRWLRELSNEDVCRWFEREGVRLVTQDDQCVFPQSQDAMEIVGTLQRLMAHHGVEIKTNHRVRRIAWQAARQPLTSGIEALASGAEAQADSTFIISTDHGEYSADRVLVTTGGSPKRSGLDFLADFPLEIVPPVPSLFSLCLGDGQAASDLRTLMGTVVEEASVSLVGSKHKASGALLITHWGVSGPAILKLSSYAARSLAAGDYKAQLAINWLGNITTASKQEPSNACLDFAEREPALALLIDLATANPRKQLSSVYPPVFNARLWRHLLLRAKLNPNQRWGEIVNTAQQLPHSSQQASSQAGSGHSSQGAASSKALRRLAATLTNDIYTVVGKNKFKDEFVTCGGVSLNNINTKTLRIKAEEAASPVHLYFAGEVLDIDAVTGGFNLQAAWTTAYIAAKAIAE